MPRLRPRADGAGSRGGALCGVTDLPVHRPLLAFCSSISLAVALPLASAQSGGASAQVQRLAEHAARDQFTARDLLGKDVVDRDGEKLGQVIDIELGAGFPAALASALGQSRSAPEPRSSPRPRDAATPANSTPVDRATTADQPTEAAVIIQAGSILGIGGELMRAPASLLRLDEENDRLVLEVRKSELDSMLTAGSATTGTASPTDSSGAGVALRDTNPEQDRRLLLDAIARTPELQEVADRINPMVNEVDVVVFGTVHSAAQRRAVIGLIERHTDKPVRDRLQVDPSVKADSTGAAE